MQTRKIAYITALGLAVACNILLFITRGEIGALFGSSEDTSGMVADVIPIFLIGLVFYAFSRITTSGFYATEKALYSYLCVYAEPILLLALLLVLPVFFGQEGVWWSVVLSQVLTAMLAFVLKTDVDRRERIKHGIK